MANLLQSGMALPKDYSEGLFVRPVYEGCSQGEKLGRKVSLQGRG